MGRLVGVGTKKVVKTYTEEEVKELTANFELEIKKIKDENKKLVAQVKELTEKTKEKE